MLKIYNFTKALLLINQSHCILMSDTGEQDIILLELEKQQLTEKKKKRK